MTRPDPARRALLAAAIAAAVAAGCSSSTPPPSRLYRLPPAPPETAAVLPAAAAEQWQIVGVALPDYLDRDVLLVPEGRTGMQPLVGHRWAEPLRDAVPRLLRQDLAALAGADRVWTAPVPAGVAITRRLRVEIQALEAAPDRAAVRLRARWTVDDPRAPAAVPVVRQAEVAADVAGADVDALVVAHRLALWRLAQRIAAAPGV